MGKTGKWIKSLLSGKKAEKEKWSTQEAATLVGPGNPTTPISVPPTTPKDKKRWSFRRSSATSNTSGPLNLSSTEAIAGANTLPAAVSIMDSQSEEKKLAMAVAAAKAAAAEAAVAAAKAQAELNRLSMAANERCNPYEHAAAIMIQSTFRSYLARKALRALRGLVKLQALVRGHLVRKQAKATLRCMQALLTVQARVRAQRIQMAGDGKPVDQRRSPHRRAPQDSRPRHSYNDADRSLDENIKIVEMDIGESRGSTKSRKSYSTHSHTEQAEHTFSAYNPPYSMQDEFGISPVPSAMTEMSPRVRSGHFEDLSFNTAQSSPQFHSAFSKPEIPQVPFSFHQSEYPESLNYDCSLFPNYMANTESSRAKARSQSAPKCRPDSYERQPSRRRPSIEGRNVPRGMRMQRSSSQVGSAVQGYNYPWSIKLDQSNASLKASECGSTSTVLTTNTYCRSVAGHNVSIRHPISS
uniref:DUF4005 domain-containing protein n=1 Tax=Kalanchoe fedtschenkoi TaxID=63787 RepID=A0A7N0TFE2_KALFE